MREYAADTFTENDVKSCLDQAGLRYIDKDRYILAHCPSHDDTHPSVQIYKDDWFANCHAGCGRFHITKAFPSLRNSASPIQRKDTGDGGSGPSQNTGTQRQRSAPKVSEHEYKEFDQMEYWKTLPLIPRDHNFKFLPLTTLDDLGWRWLEDKQSYYIPYFNRPKTKIPFSQLRHLKGERRFTFLKDAKPTLYGTWNLMPNMGKIFLVEGTSDMAVLETCGIPCLAAPSAASGVLVGKMCQWANQNGVQVVYAGDRDEAGDKLMAIVDENAKLWRRKQAREPYKDWGEMYEAEGYDSVVSYCMKELDPTWESPILAPKKLLTDEEKILDLFPGATVLQIRGRK